jgi:DNA end-binding protein Ku
MRDALAKTKKMAIGQRIMHGREHLVGITAHKKGLMLVTLRYEDELRKPESYFDKIAPVKASADAVKLAVNLVEQQSGKFEPRKLPNEYAQAIHELVQAKVEQRAPVVAIAPESGEVPKVVNIMDALKKSMQARGQAKVREAVRRRMGKEPASEKHAQASKSTKPTTGARRSVH